jgi:hypothetical protein
MKVLTTEVDIAGSIAIDDIVRENDFAERLTITYSASPGGAVTVLSTMQNDARPGKPPIWIRCSLPRFMVREIEKMLEDEIEEERQLGAVA